MENGIKKKNKEPEILFLNTNFSFKEIPLSNGERYEAVLNMQNGTEVSLFCEKTAPDKTLRLSYSGENAGIARIIRLASNASDLFLRKEFIQSNSPEGGILKFYALEKIFSDLSREDIQKIERGDLIPYQITVVSNKDYLNRGVINNANTHPVQYVTMTKALKDGDDVFTRNTRYARKLFACRVEYINKGKTRVFFKSYKAKNERTYFSYNKKIAVFYSFGRELLDCEQGKNYERVQGYEKVFQRIIPISDYGETKRGNVYVAYCSDWAVFTSWRKTGTPIHDMAYAVPQNLALHLGISEQLIRQFTFEELWELCRTTS